MFKYQDRLDAIRLANGENCIQSYSAKNIKAFRWTFNEIDNPKNFIPPAIRTGNEGVCGEWALSFNETKDQSKAAWQHLIDRNPNLYKKLGTAIAEGIIETTDGICCEANSSGHFDCHEYVGTNFETKFAVVEILRDDN